MTNYMHKPSNNILVTENNKSILDILQEKLKNCNNLDSHVYSADPQVFKNSRIIMTKIKDPMFLSEIQRSIEDTMDIMRKNGV
jgi:hypothetical protein